LRANQHEVIRTDQIARLRPRAEGHRRGAGHRRRTAEMKAAAERDRKVRVEGNINLLAALRDAGVRRYLLQSSGFWYAPGAGLADESVPFISSASPGVEASARTYMELEVPVQQGRRVCDTGYLDEDVTRFIFCRVTVPDKRTVRAAIQNVTT